MCGEALCIVFPEGAAAPSFGSQCFVPGISISGDTFLTADVSWVLGASLGAAQRKGECSLSSVSMGCMGGTLFGEQHAASPTIPHTTCCPPAGGRNVSPPQLFSLRGVSPRQRCSLGLQWVGCGRFADCAIRSAQCYIWASAQHKNVLELRTLLNYQRSLEVGGSFSLSPVPRFFFVHRLRRLRVRKEGPDP